VGREYYILDGKVFCLACGQLPCGCYDEDSHRPDDVSVCHNDIESCLSCAWRQFLDDGAALSVVIYFMGTPGEHSLPARQLADPDPVCVPIPLHLINSSCSLAAAGFLNDSVQGLTWNP